MGQTVPKGLMFAGTESLTLAVTGVFVVSAANEKCVRVDGLVSIITHSPYRLRYLYCAPCHLYSFLHIYYLYSILR